MNLASDAASFKVISTNLQSARERKHLPLLLLLGFLITSFFIVQIWFGSSELLVYSDTHFPFMNLPKYLERILSIQDTAYFPASYDIRHLFLYTYPLPLIPFADCWNLAIASLLQRIMLFALIFLALGSISYLLSTISKITSQKISYPAIFVAALIYCFNVYAVVVIWRPLMPYIFHYALFPLFLSFSLRFFSTENKKYLLAIMLTSFLIFPSYTIAPSLVFDFMIVMLLFLSTRKVVKRSLVRTIYALIKIFAPTLALLIPLILVAIANPSLLNTQYNAITSLTESPGSLADLVRYNSASIIHAIFYSGYPPLYTSSFNWYANYTSHFGPLMLVFVGGLTAFGIIIALKKDNTHGLWFAFLAIWFVGLFMLTGSNPPFPQVKLLIFHTSLFDLLRSVYARFGEYVVLSSVPFIGVALTKVISLRKSKICKVATTVFLATIFLIPLLPVLNADFLRAQGPAVPSDQVRFPQCYNVVSQLDYRGDEDFLYLTIPSSFGITRRTWNNGTCGYLGPDIFPFILDGASVRDEKLRNNAIDLIIHNKTTQLQDIMPIRYVILTFDQGISSDMQRQTLKNYLSLFKTQIQPSYLDENLAIFRLPDRTGNELSSWRIFVLNQTKAALAHNVFVDSNQLLIHENLPLDVTYVLPKYIGRAFDFHNLTKMKIVSTVDLIATTEGYYVYPIFVVLPGVTERLYLAAEFKPLEKSWNIYTGFWASDTMRWNYTTIMNSTSNSLTFAVDFRGNSISVEDNVSRREFQLPKEWSRILSLRLEQSGNMQKILGGEIGIFAGENLTDTANIEDFVVQTYENQSSFTPHNVNAFVTRTEKISPTHYKVTANASEPFVLAFLEAYDSTWTASINDKRISSFPLYGVFNGFWINKTGNLEITIEYEPQKWFYYGSIISFTTFLACTTYLTYAYSKTKNIPTKIRNKLQHLAHLKSKSATRTPLYY